VVGEGAEATAVDLSRFESLGRVDFALEAGDLAAAVNKYLQTSGPRACPEVEHLHNGDFEQWLRVGDTLWPPVVIPFDVPPMSVAVAPAGAWAYVGVQKHEAVNVLRVFDVACNVARAEEVQLEVPPLILLMSPDGLHAYAGDVLRLQLIDTTTHRAIGPAFAPGAGSMNQHSELLEALTLNAVGGRLYVVERYTQLGDTQNGARRQLHVFDTEKLAQVLAGGQTDIASARLLTAPLERIPQVNAIAVTPDETRLFAIVFQPDVPNSGSLRVLDLSDLSLEGETIPLGARPNTLALSPDGALALVTDETNHDLTFITIGRGGRAGALAVAGTVEIAPTPRGVVITSDGQRAYTIGDQVLSYIDLNRRELVERLQLGQFVIALAVTPQGDRVYVVDAPHRTSGGPQFGQDALYSIQVGARQPFEWNVTSGQVAPVCLPAPFHQVAFLGLPHSQLTTVDAVEAQQQPTSISQVVPVVEKCAYDFSFNGIASEVGAVAEVFWLGSDCGLLQPGADTIPIEVVRMPAVQISPAATTARASRIITESAPLVPHRERLHAPAGATQAEIRFTMPLGAVGAVEAVSLVGTNEVVENADLTLQSGGRLRGWQMTPATATGFTLVETETGVRLRNAGTNLVELNQTVQTQDATSFTLELQGQTETRAPDQSNAQLAIEWLDNQGQAVAPSVVIELRPAGFGVSTASGKVPAGAVSAALRLLVPAGVTQFVKRISLRFPHETSVPLIFYAQAPGELTLRDWHVAYEGAPAVAPALPADGLCPATPPGQQPGSAVAQSDTQFCQCCADEQPVVGSTALRTASGRPATTRRCATCGSDIVSFGGRNVATTQRVAASSPMVTRALLHVAPLRTNAGLSTGVSPVTTAAAAQPFEAIKGIGAVRTQDLKAVGIDSIEVLAAARPEDVAQVKGIPLKLASDFIRQAQDLLTFKKT
jgi:DNA-binding beta-propeller fold protein YncE/predicted flap endonuclease-1-like 5' DNA nuclease